MPLTAAAGTSVDRMGPDRVMNWISPLRSCASMSTSDPSWPPGNTWIDTRPRLSDWMAEAASFSRTLSGWVAERMLPAVSRMSVARARASDGAAALRPRPPARNRNWRRAGMDFRGVRDGAARLSLG